MDVPPFRACFQNSLPLGRGSVQWPIKISKSCCLLMDLSENTGSVPSDSYFFFLSFGVGSNFTPASSHIFLIALTMSSSDMSRPKMKRVFLHADLEPFLAAISDLTFSFSNTPCPSPPRPSPPPFPSPTRSRQRSLERYGIL